MKGLQRVKRLGWPQCTRGEAGMRDNRGFRQEDGKKPCGRATEGSSGPRNLFRRDEKRKRGRVPYALRTRVFGEPMDNGLMACLW